MLKNLFFVILLMVSNIFASNISITDAYVRAVPPNLNNSASFMTISNNSNKDVTLEGIDSIVAKNIELHKHTMENGMMKMKQIKSIKIPANSTVELKPGGLHVMLIGLNKKLKIGEEIESFTFNFSNNISITINHIPIKSIMMGMKHK